MLFDRHYRELVSYSYRYTSDPSTSEDLIQEVFLYLWENADKIEVNTCIRSYLFSMARNKCLNYLKSLKLTDKAGILDMETSVLEEVAIDNFSEEENELRDQKIQKMLMELPEKMLEIFKLRVLSGYSYKEISLEMNVSINTVKTQLQRAKSKLEKTAFLLVYFIFLS